MIKKLLRLQVAFITITMLTWAFMEITMFALLVYDFSPYICFAILYLAAWAAFRLIKHVVNP